jgi:hypothetical protein
MQGSDLFRGLKRVILKNRALLEADKVTSLFSITSRSRFLKAYIYIQTYINNAGFLKLKTGNFH